MARANRYLAAVVSLAKLLARLSSDKELDPSVASRYKRGMTKDDLAILTNTLQGNETPPDYAIKLLEDTCARSGLDWKMRHVYLMKRSNKWMVTLSIDGFRAIAANHDDYAGQEGPFWVTSAEGTWTDIPPEGAIYASKVGVKHKSGNTTWGVARYKDYAAGPMWSKFPSTMIAKCAEMLALRKAMPGALGGLYGVEEMEQANKGKERANAESFRSEDTIAYSIAIERADAGTIRDIGKRISSDPTLAEDELARLHKLYTERKAALGV